METEIYLDYAATAKPLQAAVDECVRVLSEDYGNPSSLHRKGFLAEKLITASREMIGAALGCKSEEIIFTSGATEADNLAVFGAAAAKKRQGKRIITTAIEHPAVAEPIKRLEQEGYDIVRLMPDQSGRYSCEQFAEAVTSDTVLVSAMWVNNETGLILPVTEIAEAVKRVNPECLVHIDGVQGFCRLPIVLKNSKIDLFSISGHKLGAPKGIGALYCKKGVRIIPQLLGGGQEGGIRSGTESVPLIASFGKAVQEASSHREKSYDQACGFRELFKKLAYNKIAEGDIKLHGDETVALPHIMSVAICKIRSEVMLHYLEQSGIYVSSGSACAKGKQSMVLAALGYSKQEADETLRISFGHDTTNEHIEKLVECLYKGMDTLARKR